MFTDSRTRHLGLSKLPQAVAQGQKYVDNNNNNDNNSSVDQRQGSMHDELPFVLSDDPWEAYRIALTACVFAVVKDTKDTVGDKGDGNRFYTEFRELFASSLLRHQERWDEAADSSAVQENTGRSLVNTDDDDDNDDECGWFRSLRSLRWVEDELLSTLASVVKDAILERIREGISGEYEEDELLDSFDSWRDGVVVSD